MASKNKVNKFYGMGRMIARKTGYNEVHVREVLSGKRSRNGKKGKHIVELAQQLTESLADIQTDED